MVEVAERVKSRGQVEAERRRRLALARHAARDAAGSRDRGRLRALLGTLEYGWMDASATLDSLDEAGREAVVRLAYYAALRLHIRDDD